MVRKHLKKKIFERLLIKEQVPHIDLDHIKDTECTDMGADVYLEYGHSIATTEAGIEFTKML